MSGKGDVCADESKDEKEGNGCLLEKLKVLDELDRGMIIAYGLISL